MLSKRITLARGKSTESVNHTDSYYICIRKCYFDSRLWQINEDTPYIKGIENSPYFEKEIEE